MKETICTVAGVVGGFIATILGGWDSAIVTLLIFMGVDFVTGFVTAAIGKSKHSDTGTLNSKAGGIGLGRFVCATALRFSSHRGREPRSSVPINAGCSGGRHI